MVMKQEGKIALLIGGQNISFVSGDELFCGGSKTLKLY
jgi:hypothetical protein